MNLLRYTLNYLKEFNPKKIGRYVRRIPIYYKKITRAHNFEKIVACAKKDCRYAIVSGGKEEYIFDIRDRLIPQTIYVEGETFSESNILNFFDLTKKHYGYTPDGCEGQLFLDIGANIGTTSIFVAKNMCKNMKIIAFEPDDINYKCLKANAILNGCDNVICENIALSDSIGTELMEVNAENRGSNKIVTTDMIENDLETISTDTLDHYFSENGKVAADVKYIWMDTEGYEPFVIAGAGGVLKLHRIPLFMEFLRDRMDRSAFEKLRGILSEYYEGFVVFEAGNNMGEFEIAMFDDLYRNGKSAQYDLFFY